MSKKTLNELMGEIYVYVFTKTLQSCGRVQKNMIWGSRKTNKKKGSGFSTFT